MPQFEPVIITIEVDPYLTVPNARLCRFLADSPFAYDPEADPHEMYGASFYQGPPQCSMQRSDGATTPLSLSERRIEVAHLFSDCRVQTSVRANCSTSRLLQYGDPIISVLGSD